MNVLENIFYIFNERILCIIKINIYSQKNIKTPDIIFDIVLLVGAGHYSSFM